MWSLNSALIGAFIAAASASSLALNTCAALVLQRYFLGRSSSPVYILVFLNICGDMLQLVCILVYLAPTSIAQSYAFGQSESDSVNLIFAALFQIQWYQSLLTQVLMAVNRFVVVVFPRRAGLFTRQFVVGATIGVVALAAALSVVADVFLPCCITHYYYGAYSFKFMGKGFNYKNYFMDIPMNVTATVAPIVLYGILFVMVRRGRRAGRPDADKPTVVGRRRQSEIRCAIQFACISVAFAMTWISFRVLPLVVSSKRPEIFTLTTIGLILHCSTSALVYLSMNAEFRAMFYRLILRRRIRTSAATTAGKTMITVTPIADRTLVGYSSAPVPSSRISSYS